MAVCAVKVTASLISGSSLLMGRRVGAVGHLFGESRKNSGPCSHLACDRLDAETPLDASSAGLS